MASTARVATAPDLPDYVASAQPVPQANRIPWYKSTAQTYAGIMLWFVFWANLPAGGGTPGGALPEKLDVPLGLGGTLTSPSVSVRAGDAVQGLLKGQVEQVKKSAQQEAEKAGKKALEGVLDRFKR